jgi:hypothetical protein
MKPISAYGPSPHFRFGPTAIAEIPEIARKLGEAVAHWSFLELQLGRSLSKLFGSDAQIGVAVYAAIQSPAAQRDALLSAAREVLDGQTLKLFRCLVAVTTGLGTERNRIVHGLWGVSHDIPGAGVLMDGKLLLPVSAAVDRLTSDADLPQGPSHDSIFVYTADDFDDLVERIRNTRGYFIRFWAIQDELVPEERPAKIQELLDEPTIAPIAKQQRR